MNKKQQEGTSVPNKPKQKMKQPSEVNAKKTEAEIKIKAKAKAEKGFGKKKTPQHSSPQDPYAGREAKKYEKPIPSREFILEQLSRAGQPLFFPALSDLLLIEKDEEQEQALQRRLRAMTRDGQIVQNRRGAFGIVEKMDLIKGRVSANAGGFGFLITGVAGDDLFLSPGQMKALFDGDIILAKVSGIDRRGRKEGRVVEILERNTHEVVGRCFYESGAMFLTPDSKKITQDVLIIESDHLLVKDGQFVVVEITQQPSYRAPAIGKIKELLGDHMAPGMEIDVAIRAHQIPHVWPNEVNEEVKNFSALVQPKDISQRIDLRHLNFVTIDGEDARDFDDAVFCQKEKNAWRLWVAIADVAHYVESGSALDQEAIKRGNSVYFPQRVIPMLPEVLSNGLCSLNPKVDRLTLVCEMKIDSHGELLEYQFMEACIHSKARLTYTEVAAFLDKGSDSEKFQTIKDDIRHLHELYKALKKKRDQRGAINVETTESRFIFNAEKKIEAVVPVVRNVAHQIIEEAMLIANVCAARVLQAHKLPALYRIHDAPTEAKISDLKDYLLPLGFRFSAGKQITPAHFQEVIAFANGRKDQALINIIVLRSMQQAVYSGVCSQHFGLAYEQYAHFTSPIRRYPDLVVHRAIKYLLRSKIESAHVRRVAQLKPLLKPEMLVEDKGKLAELAQYVSATERRADLATRDATDWLKCEFMLDKVGEIFPGKISSVTAFGLFVLLDDIFIEGLVHISDLQNDYYHYDDRRHELTGERSKKVFCLADPVTIRVASVNLDDKKIEFSLIVDDKDVLARPNKKSHSKGKKGFAGASAKNNSKSNLRNKEAPLAGNSSKKRKSKAKRKKSS